MGNETRLDYEDNPEGDPKVDRTDRSKKRRLTESKKKPRETEVL